MTTTQMPDAKATSDFLLQGGAFALLCVLVIVALTFAWFGGRAVFQLLKSFLAQLIQQLEAHTTELGAQTTLLTRISEANNPDWLQKRLDTLERHSEHIRGEIVSLRVALGASGRVTTT